MSQPDRGKLDVFQQFLHAAIWVMVLAYLSCGKTAKAASGISAEEFPGFRRIMVPGAMDTVRPPLVFIAVDSGAKRFTVMIAPVDTSRFRGKTNGFFRGDRPVKYAATFPDSQTLHLVVQTTPFAKVQAFYAYLDNHLFLDIYDQPVLNPAAAENRSGQTRLFPNIEPATTGTGTTARLTEAKVGEYLFLKSLFLAVLIIIPGIGLAVVWVRTTNLRPAMTGRPVTSPVTDDTPRLSSGMKSAEFGSQAGEPDFQEKTDDEIRAIMKQQGITYSEARIIAWMQSRNTS